MTQKLSLGAQIEEVTREIEMRKKVFPPMVKNRQMREREMEYRIDAMVSVLTTLQWLQENESTIREWAKSRAEPEMSDAQKPQGING